ncbi:MAG TPA: hypothetical protein VF795_11420 [Desulfuromonadaceae bacterium]
MIVRMSKLEITGPKELLLPVLDIVREEGAFQPEADPSGFVTARHRQDIRALVPDQRMVAERLFLERVRGLVDELLHLLPPLAVRESLLEPAGVLDTIAAGAGRHLALCRDLANRRDTLLRERQELERSALVLTTIGSLIEKTDGGCGLEFMGVTLRDPLMVERLRPLLERLTGGEVTLTTTQAADGTLIGLITSPAPLIGLIRKAVKDEQLPELPFPEDVRDLPLPERIRRLRERLATVTAEGAELDARLERFSLQWLAIYRRIDRWLGERLALLATTGVVHETGMCFILYGWALADRVAGLGRRLTGRFGGRVVLEEGEVLEQDLDRVPVALRNPPYLRPFELFTRLLPLPRYSSWDPTPFLGIFFPLFFGMMLGDAGYGLLLMATALLILRRRRQGALADAGRILLISSSYAVLFGILFGELFGEAGARLLHLKPLVMERGRAIMPMLIFSLAAGACHLLLGMLLGLAATLKRREHRQSMARIATIGLFLCLAALVVSLVLPFPWLFTRPIMVVAAVLVPFLLLSGGFLAPLELLRYIGNMVSYARIMAIGLCSVLLANAANHVAGLSGDLILGTLAAVVLHAVAIILGVFAPTIHVLRLHVVEFFSKFVEPGGRRFEPLHK